MQRFINGLPQTYRDRIEFDEPKTLEETIWKARYCYEQFGNKTGPHEDWRRGVVRDSRRRDLNPQDLRIMERVLG